VTLQLSKVAASALVMFFALGLYGCGQTSAIQATDKSRSHFADAAFKGESVALGEPTTGA